MSSGGGAPTSLAAWRELACVAPVPADVAAAAQRIAGQVHRTPLLSSRSIDAIASHGAVAADGAPRLRLFFKCENMQRVGAFKFRGACNAVATLPEDEARRCGVVTHSSGNHAQALALAAMLRGIPCTVVMPRTAPAVKRRAVEETYGARVVPCEPTLQAREEATARVVADTGACLVHPFDNRFVIAGQGTCFAEVCAQLRELLPPATTLGTDTDAAPPLDVVVVPVGGGGLLAGTCLASADLVRAGRVRVFAAEPEGADDCYRSVQCGHFVPQTAPNTVADGLLTSLGTLTWPIIRDHVAAVVTVSDDEIRAAMRLVWERLKLVIEPSAAVPLAAVLSPKFGVLIGEQQQQRAPVRIAVVLTGGNVDLSSWRW